jgi:hypothetical protein
MFSQQPGNGFGFNSRHRIPGCCFYGTVAADGVSVSVFLAFWQKTALRVLASTLDG